MTHVRAGLHGLGRRRHHPGRVNPGDLEAMTGTGTDHLQVAAKAHRLLLRALPARQPPRRQAHQQIQRNVEDLHPAVPGDLDL